MAWIHIQPGASARRKRGPLIVDVDDESIRRAFRRAAWLERVPASTNGVEMMRKDS